MSESEMIKAAVLAECERVCPQKPSIEKPNMPTVGRIFILRKDGELEWTLFHPWNGFRFAIKPNMSDAQAMIAYHLLGLETRRAVEAERAKVAKLVKALEIAKSAFEAVLGDWVGIEIPYIPEWLEVPSGALNEVQKALAAWKGENV